jgi:molybdenum cofactor cytidylyltransferase
MSGVSAIVLAAGRSTRMGDRHKLLEPVAGQPMIRHAVSAALASRAKPVIVVTGYRQRDVETALQDLDIVLVHNPDFADGMASSLIAGIYHVPAQSLGALILLGDMPRITSDIVNQLVEAAMLAGPHRLCVPSFAGNTGNPVFVGSDWFPAIRKLTGDSGARGLIRNNPAYVTAVEIGNDAIFFDVDTPEILDKLAKDFTGTKR